MIGSRSATAVLFALAFSAGAAARADTVYVEPGADALATAIAQAAPGDTLMLAPGLYHGPVVVDRALTLDGSGDAVVEAHGEGSVITVTAEDAVVRGLTVRGSGISLFDQHAGIYLEETAHRALVEDNLVEGNLFGVYLQGPSDAIVRHNRIIGRTDLRVNERGNGVQIWRSPGSQILNNDFLYGRDGIFVTNSRENRFVGNRFRELRFGVHYMYTHDSEVSHNLSIGNHIGFALMFSEGLTVIGNVSEGDRDQGLQLNYTNESTLVGNRVPRDR